MKLFIITGSSKGLGASLLNQTLEEGHLVISISRSKALKHPNHIHIGHDLSKSKRLDMKLDKALGKIDLKIIKSVHLINNAAVIEPIGTVENFKIEDMEMHLKLNLLTPMVICRWLMASFTKKMPITIVNISSGAAFHTIVNWSMYCSTKSGLKMFTDCLNVDYADRKNFKALSFSPGVMDTSMQATIRSKSKKTFKNIEKFKNLKKNNQLLSPDQVASGLLTLIKSQKNITDTHYDIRNLNMT